MMYLHFPGVTLEQDDTAIILQSKVPLYMLSSAVVGGGFAQVQTIINRHVAQNYDCSNPPADLQAFAVSRGISNPFVGLLTAVWMQKARCITLSDSGLTVSTVITAGVGNTSASGISKPQTIEAGTINIIVFVDGHLVPGAMVNAVMTVTEAKTAVLVERDVRTPEGAAATGTSTDAVVIACTGRGTPIDYAGPATLVGYLIGRCVRECLAVALDAA